MSCDDYNKKQQCSCGCDSKDRFSWKEGEIKLIKTEYVPTEEEISHAKEVIDKVMRKFSLL